jgi:hypothetical protein
LGFVERLSLLVLPLQLVLVLVIMMGLVVKVLVRVLLLALLVVVIGIACWSDGAVSSSRLTRFHSGSERQTAIDDQKPQRTDPTP